MQKLKKQITSAILIFLLLPLSACQNPNSTGVIEPGHEQVEAFSARKTESESQNMTQAGVEQTIKIDQRSVLDEHTALETRATIFLDEQGKPSKLMNPMADSILLKDGKKVLYQVGNPEKLQSWAFFNVDGNFVIWVSIVQDGEQDPEKQIASYQTVIHIPEEAAGIPEIESFGRIDPVPMNLTFKNPNEYLNSGTTCDTNR